MSEITSTTLLPEFIKMRWNEPFVSAGLNRKTFKSTPRGVYSGFVVKPGPGAFDVTIAHDDPEGYGVTTGFGGGAFDTASGWSVAVHESIQGFNTTVAILSSAQSNYSFDLSAEAGTTVYVALYVDYRSGVDSTAKIKVLEAVDLEADPSLINLARIDVPLVGPITTANVVYDDPSYPRVLPFATEFKFGYMDKSHVTLLNDLVDATSGAPAFVYEVEIETDGAQEILLPPGFVYTVGGHDLWVHKNGSLKSVDVDYEEVDRGDGYGEKIDYIAPLYETDKVKLRVQQYASVLTSRTRILDEYALISENVSDVNFSGAGVSVLPDGPSRVKIVIPGSGASSGIRTKQNATGSTIAQYRAVALNDDNTIKLFDPAVSGDNFYGLTIQMIPDGSAGDIQVLGVVEGAASSISGAVVGGDCYVSDAGDGTLTFTPPDGSLGQIVRVGMFEASNTIVSNVATDILIDKGRLA